MTKEEKDIVAKVGEKIKAAITVKLTENIIKDCAGKSAEYIFGYNEGAMVGGMAVVNAIVDTINDIKDEKVKDDIAELIKRMS